MAEIVNTAQAQEWDGAQGTHWAEHDDLFNAVNSGFNEPLLAAASIVEGDHVLDIGCGNGQLTRLAARRAGFGYATGLDLSRPMLARARSRARSESVTNVSFEHGDAQVYPFRAAEFDVAVSRFGIMFFDDPVAAFANIGVALRPGGRLTFVAMTSMAGQDLGTVLAAVPMPPSDSASSNDRGPTSFADPGRIETVLSAAEFTDIDCTWVEAEAIWGPDSTAAAEFLATSGPVQHAVKHAGPAAQVTVRRALADAFRQFEDGGGVRLRATAWLVTAITPLR